MNRNQQNADAALALQWVKFPVLSDGFVTLVDVMGDDSSVVQAARVSYGNDKRQEISKIEEEIKCLDNWGLNASEDTPQDEFDKNLIRLIELDRSLVTAKQDREKDDRTLIRYLMRHRHSTPFEMAEVKILVRVPMDTWRQWIRHRTANVNEYSTRYTEAIDSMDATGPEQWRTQSESNKQGSSGESVTQWPEGISPEPYGNTGRCEITGAHVSGFMPIQLIGDGHPGEYLSELEDKFHATARDVYQTRLKFKVAKEQARKDLPLSTYTEAYWKCDLHNVLGFLALRMDSHAQQEIRQYATIIGEQIIKPLFPIVWEAFEDYRLGAMALTRLELLVVNNLVAEMGTSSFDQNEFDEWSKKPEWYVWERVGWNAVRCRERDECIQKLIRMGLLSE